MIVLPINSVINPVLYDNTIREFVNRRIRKGIELVRGLENVTLSFTLSGGNDSVTGRDDPLPNVEVRKFDSEHMEPWKPPDRAAHTGLRKDTDYMEKGMSADTIELKLADPEDITKETKIQTEGS
jgi:hypothetical protein